MPKLEDSQKLESARSSVTLPVSVIVPREMRSATCRVAWNPCARWARCTSSIRKARDATAAIAESFGAQVVQFHYQGGWPKKRQWAMDTLPFSYEWVLLIDADEALTPELPEEIKEAIQSPAFDGYYIGLRMFFLGRELRHGGASFYKLSLFRRGKGRFECRLKDQDDSMADMEVHEHVVVESSDRTRKLKNRCSITTWSRSRATFRSTTSIRTGTRGCGLKAKRTHRDLAPSLFGTQAQRRRWLRKRFFRFPVRRCCSSFTGTFFAWDFWTACPA